MKFFENSFPRRFFSETAARIRSRGPAGIFSAAWPAVIIASVYLKHQWMNLGGVDRVSGFWYEFFFLLSVAYLLPSGLRRPRGAGLVIWLFFDLVESLLIAGNTIYHRRFQEYISLNLFSMIDHVGFVWKDVVSLVRWTDLFYIADFFLIFLFLNRFRNKKSLAPAVAPLFRRRYALAGLLISLVLLFGRYGRIQRELPEVYAFKYGPTVLMETVSVHSFYLLDLGYSVFFPYFERAPVPKIQELPECVTHGDERVDPKIGRTSPGANVILVQLESFAFELLNRKVEGQEITPTLNRLAKTGLSFDFFISQCLAGSTTDAEFAALTSYYTNDRNVAGIHYAKNVPFALPKFLREHGYSTVFFHANDGYFYSRQTVMPTLGFEETNFAPYFRSEKREFPGTDDLPFFLESAKILQTKKQPFMAYLVTISAHSPYGYPKGETPMLRLTAGAAEKSKAAYWQISRYVDNALGVFLDSLDACGILRNSVLMVMADHHPPGIAWQNAPDTTLPLPVQRILGARIPMVMNWPGCRKPGKTLSIPCSQMDISPTLLAVLGHSKPMPLLGTNLLQPKPSGFVLRNSSPAVLIYGNQFAWGFLSEGLRETYPSRAVLDPHLLDGFLRVLQYSNAVLQGDSGKPGI